MKNKAILSFIKASLAGLIMASCAIVEEYEPTKEERLKMTIVGPTFTKGMAQEDSLLCIMAYQTNKTLMLLHQIKEVDGVFFLDLTEDDIRELSIPESLYNDVMEMIDGANE